MAKFERRNAIVEALQHDGSDESALQLEAWVLAGGGDAVAHLKGSIDFAQESAFLRVNSTRAQVYVGPGAWVVKVADKTFYPVSRDDFEILYKPAMLPDLPDPVRTIFKSTTPDGKVWTESRSEAEILDQVQGRTDLQFWRLDVYEHTDGWQQYRPDIREEDVVPITDSAMAEMEATDE